MTLLAFGSVTKREEREKSMDYIQYLDAQDRPQESQVRIISRFKRILPCKKHQALSVCCEALRERVPTEEKTTDRQIDRRATEGQIKAKRTRLGIYPKSAFCADSLAVLVCNRKHQHKITRVKNPQHLQTCHCLDTRKYCTHW